MADTGSEVAEGTTRGTTSTIARLLERRFLWEKRSDPHNHRTQGNEDDVELSVRCPEKDFDKRAQEVLEAFDRADVRTSVSIDDARHELVVSVSRDDLEKAQRALERLHASGRSDFTIGDVDGLEDIEVAVGRRTLGRTGEVDGTRSADAPDDAAVESSTLTFANHPDDPEADARHAEAYAKGMRDLGFDAEAREITGARARGDGVERTRSHVVGVSYLVSDREEFVLASTVTLHDIGALADFGAEDPYENDSKALDRDREWLVGQSQLREERYEKNDAGADEPTTHELTADEYGRMPARDRAKVAPERVPKESFGSQSAKEVAREQQAAASAINATREPARSHPSIGERVG